MSRWWLVLAASVAAIWAVASCGGGGGGGTDPGAPDAAAVDEVGVDPGTGSETGTDTGGDPAAVDPGKEEGEDTGTGTDTDTGTGTDMGTDMGTDAGTDVGKPDLPWIDHGPADVPPEVPPTVCGNEECDGTEDCESCPEDCGECPPFCGDGTCDEADGEDCATCALDCEACPGPCGNGECEPDQAETCETCPDDCGACPPPCGDGDCNSGVDENCLTCPEDCGTCPSCPDGECQPGETCSGCPDDCGACPSECGDGWCEWGKEECNVCIPDCGPCTPVCGDGSCYWPESCDSCPADCTGCWPPCGDAACDAAGGETCATCREDCGDCPAACGDGACGAGEVCDNCPDDCGDCPPTIAFNRYWQVRMTGPLVAGGAARLYWDPYRSGCQQWEQGTPIWTTFLYHSFDPAGAILGGPAVRHLGSPNGLRTAGLFQPAQVPAGARDVWLWAKSVGYLGCLMWDSRNGENWRVPVFTEAEVAADVTWVGGFDFVLAGPEGTTSLGDADPAWYFASMTKEAKATSVQVEVRVDGVTDRAYQTPEMARQVAQAMLSVNVVTDAWGAGPPGQEKKAFPLPMMGASADGKSFVYRWFPGTLTWGETPIADGAYSYRFEVSTRGNGSVHAVEPAGGGDRTVVLSQKPECALFPKNPPAEYCP